MRKHFVLMALAACVSAGAIAQERARPAAAPPAPAAAAPAPLVVAPEARPRFLASCRQTLVSRNADAARWADEQCAAEWDRIAASAAATDALLAALPAARGETVSLAALRQRLAGVRWAAKPGARGVSASGRLGDLSVTVVGAPAAAQLSMNWMRVGAEPPYDVIGAMRVRGVQLTEIACEEFGSGEWQRVFSGIAPGRAPFRLEVGQRIAPFANSNSYYGAMIELSGQAPRPGASAPACTNPSNQLL